MASRRHAPAYDLAVVGGGLAGLACARSAALRLAAGAIYFQRRAGAAQPPAAAAVERPLRNAAE